MLFLINVFYFITLILLQGHQSKARGPVCLQCDQVSQPSDCRNIKRCGDQDLCSMRKYVTNNGHMWFDVGCSSSQRCSPITSILGKRNDDDGLLPISSSKLGRNGKHNIKTNYVRSAGDTIVCEKCCSGDICNAGSLCGTVGFLHEMVCFRCASTNEDGCSTIELCDQNEKCFIEKVINSSTSQNVWKTGCRHKDMCKQLQSNPETECLSSCCSSDLCNRKCTINNADAKCVDMSQTCTNETFQSFVCSTKELQAVCPRSCGLCHCSQNPCTHGTCTSTRQGYKCTCDAGYTGSICDRVIEHCSPNPCVHGICNNSPQGFSCRCSSGYKGSTCTVIELKEHCSPNPCVHGNCNNSPQGYNCSCRSGYKGSTCTVKERPFFFSPQSHIFKWSECSTSSERIVHVTNFDLFPKPIRVPGNISFTMSAEITQRLPFNHNYKLKITTLKKLLNNWHELPCPKSIMDSAGPLCSRIYDDLCEIIQQFWNNKTCPQYVIDIGLTCLCPVDPTSFTIQSVLLEWKLQHSSVLFLLNGDFRVRIELLQHNKTVGCLAVELSVTIPCTGFLCGD